MSQENLIFYVLVTFLVLETSSAYARDLLNDAPSQSPSQARERGTFIQNVSVHPEEFLWEGHTVVVSDAWIERLTTSHDGTKTAEDLCFKLQIDGSDSTNESRIFAKEGKSLAFKDADPEPKTLGIGGVTYAPRGGIVGRLVVAAIRCGRYPSEVHTVGLRTPVPSQVSLKVGTRYSHRSTEPRWDISPVAITFDVHGHGD